MPVVSQQLVRKGQRSRSNKAEDRFGGLAEASFSTPLCRVAFPVFFISVYCSRKTWTVLYLHSDNVLICHTNSLFAALRLCALLSRKFTKSNRWKGDSKHLCIDCMACLADNTCLAYVVHRMLIALLPNVGFFKETRRLHIIRADRSICCLTERTDTE